MDGFPLGRVRPLYFLHIPKTGGVSLTDALARLFPAEQVFVGPGGNLTLADLEGLGGRLDGPLFLSGHPDADVTRFLMRRADIITLLRDPRDHVVSNYLHILSDPENSYHAAAIGQPFAAFLREHPTLTAFQTFALAFALSGGGASGPQATPGFLDSLPFVGVIERPEACAEVLGKLTRAERPIDIPCLNTAIYRGVSTSTLRGLQRVYDGLRDDPVFADLMAIETRLYAHAAARLEGLMQAHAPPASKARPSFVGPWRFRDRDGPMHGEAPRRALASGPDHLVFGPYERLARGHHAAQFRLEAEGAEAGRIEVEVLANGRRSLRRRWLSVSASRTPEQLTLAFFNPDPANVLEFRVRSKGCANGVLTFRGVEIGPSRLSQTWPSMIAAALSVLRPPRRDVPRLGVSAPFGWRRPERP